MLVVETGIRKGAREGHLLVDCAPVVVRQTVPGAMFCALRHR